MNKLKLVCLASVLTTGLSYASCDNFIIKIVNNTTDDFIISHIKLTNAELKPNSIVVTLGKKDSGRDTQSFYVSASGSADMDGSMTLTRVSLPPKTVNIAYMLQKNLSMCNHTDNQSGGEYSVSNSRGVGVVTYTIG